MLILRLHYQGIAQRSSFRNMALSFKQTITEKDEKIRSLEAAVKRLRKEMEDIQKEAVGSVKDARIKQLEAQNYTTVLYEQNEHLEEMKEIQHRQIEQQNALLMHAATAAKQMSHDYNKFKIDNLALMEANEKLIKEVQQARKKVVNSDVDGKETLLLATRAGRMANEERKRQLEEKEARLLEKEAGLEVFGEKIQAAMGAYILQKKHD